MLVHQINLKTCFWISSSWYTTAQQEIKSCDFLLFLIHFAKAENPLFSEKRLALQQTIAHARLAIRTLNKGLCSPFMGWKTLKLLCLWSLVGRMVTMQWQGTNWILEDICHRKQQPQDRSQKRNTTDLEQRPTRDGPRNWLVNKENNPNVATLDSSGRHEHQIEKKLKFSICSIANKQM